MPRVASILKDGAHLYPIHCLLFTMPGVPSIYYGSEFGLPGVKAPQDDWPLRPALDLDRLRGNPRHADLAEPSRAWPGSARKLPALRHGDFQMVFLSHRCMVFSRRTPDQWVMVAISAEKKPTAQAVTLPEPVDGFLVDRLNPGPPVPVRNGRAVVSPLHPCWARVLEVRVGQGADAR